MVRSGWRWYPRECGPGAGTVAALGVAGGPGKALVLVGSHDSSNKSELALDPSRQNFQLSRLLLSSAQLASWPL